LICPLPPGEGAPRRGAGEGASLIVPALAAALLLASCGETKTPTERPPVPPEAPLTGLTLHSGSQHSLGRDHTLWRFELDGRGAEQVAVSALLLEKGTSRTYYRGTFDVPPEPLKGTLLVLQQEGAAAGGEGHITFLTDASIKPMASSGVVRGGKSLEGVKVRTTTWVGPDSTLSIAPDTDATVLSVALVPEGAEPAVVAMNSSWQKTMEATRDSSYAVFVVILSWKPRKESQP
jgi:hypothetical protein